jgi:hypothetical protein
MKMHIIQRKKGKRKNKKRRKGCKANRRGQDKARKSREERTTRKCMLRDKWGREHTRIKLNKFRSQL